jgi:hypothetical protein
MKDYPCTTLADKVDGFSTQKYFPRQFVVHEGGQQLWAQKVAVSPEQRLGCVVALSDEELLVLILHSKIEDMLQVSKGYFV